MKTKTPTLKEKVEIYERFLHKINMFCVCGDNGGISELVENADSWSYRHRAGEGMNSEKEQQEMIDCAFWKLCDTPETDNATAQRQEAYAARQAQSALARELPRPGAEITLTNWSN